MPSPPPKRDASVTLPAPRECDTALVNTIIMRRTARPAAAALAAVGMVASAGAAGAQTDPIGAALAAAQTGSADAQHRAQQWFEQTQAGSAQAASGAQGMVDRALGRTTPPPPDPTPSSPCPRTAAACIDLAGQRSWLQAGGRMDYGPVPISSGKPGYATPRGSHRVGSKVRHEVSRVYNNAPMPFSVYFTHNGIAFHEGDPAVPSHGCIHLRHDDARTYFERLQLGDEVFVY